MLETIRQSWFLPKSQEFIFFKSSEGHRIWDDDKVNWSVLTVCLRLIVNLFGTYWLLTPCRLVTTFVIMIADNLAVWTQISPESGIELFDTEGIPERINFGKKISSQQNYPAYNEMGGEWGGGGGVCMSLSIICRSRSGSTLFYIQLWNILPLSWGTKILVPFESNFAGFWRNPLIRTHRIPHFKWLYVIIKDLSA